jgi:hypothetical protein
MTQSTPTLWYSNYITQTANLIVISSNDPNYLTMLPGMIDYAEQRIWREADFLRQQVTDPTTNVSSGIRLISASTAFGIFITVDEVNILSSNSSTRYPLVPVSRAYMDMTYPSGSNATGIPQFYAMTSDTRLILGPAPDQAYGIEFIGIQRQTPLSSGNSSTYLTQYAPDLFIAASMVFAFGYMRDFGGQADNPQGSQSWENQYKMLFQSAQAEAGRAKHEGQGWTPYSASPQTTPPRS